jgi:hypothetical protein
LIVSVPALARPSTFSAGLRLQQIGGEAARARERIGDAAQHLAAGMSDEVRGVTLQCLAERIVRSDEEPGIAARLHHRSAGGLRQHVGVVDPMHRVGVARPRGQVGRRRASVEVNLVLLLGDAGHGQRDAGIGDFDDQVDTVTVEPLAGNGRPHIRLVQVIGNKNFHLEAFAGGPEFFDGLVGRGDSARAGKVFIGTRHVGQATDLQRRHSLRARRTHGKRGGTRSEATQRDGTACEIHDSVFPQGPLKAPRLPLPNSRNGASAAPVTQTPRYSCSLSMLLSSR